MDDPLRAHWDFDDLDASERRFRELLAAATDEPERAELLTQLARVEGLRGDLRAADRLLDEAEPLARGPALADARIELERGRVRRSAGEADRASSRFEAAWERACAAGCAFVAVDAAHMAALAAGDAAGTRRWTERGLELAAARPGDAGYWLGPLLNNLGWAQLEAGQPAAALASFESALRAREQEPNRRAEIEIARYAVARALRALGRAEEAAGAVEAAVAWADGEGAPDGWFHEELALAYAALGRGVEASEQAGLALPLLSAADDSFAGDTERAARLQSLADAPE